MAKHLLIRKLSYKCYYIHLYGGFFNLKQIQQTYNANPRVIQLLIEKKASPVTKRPCFMNVLYDALGQYLHYMVGLT